MHISRKWQIKEVLYNQAPKAEDTKRNAEYLRERQFPSQEKTEDKRINFMRGMDKQWKVEKESIKSNTVNQKNF